MAKEDVEKLTKALKKEKIIAMLAPSFVAEFPCSVIISRLKGIGFDKIVDLTFGAKMINREYHKILENSKELKIASVCPGIVEIISLKFPEFKKNFIKVDSPMIATAKICRKTLPKHKICFISPCEFKKTEAKKSGFVDYTIDYQELKQLLAQNSNKEIKDKKEVFDLFYNEYTRIYPLSGGLSKTAHLKGVLKQGEEKIINGIIEVEKFLKSPDKKIKFLDCTFCNGGCIGGPYLSSKDLEEKRQNVLDYLEQAKQETIPKKQKGIIKDAEGIKFTY